LSVISILLNFACTIFLNFFFFLSISDRYFHD
jgi:hypothetical protein